MLRQRRECDVYGTTRDLMAVEITIVALDPTMPPDPNEHPRKHTTTHDLSSRALKRLYKFVDRGLNPPGAKVLRKRIIE